MSVTFDYAAWIARYPEFSGVSEPLATAYFNEATLYFNNQGWPGSLTQAPTLLNMLTAHIAWLYAPRDPTGKPASTGTPRDASIVGTINTASEGSVSISTTLNATEGGPSMAWFAQTQYGLSFWQATAQYRAATYVAAPRRGPYGTAYPFAGGRGRVY